MRAATVVDGRIEVVDRPVPEPNTDEVLVRVHGAGLNRADLLQRAGFYPAPPGAPADIPGLEFAGVVAAAGADADGVTVGAHVFGIVGGGGQAQYVVTKAAHCAVVPDGLDLVAMGGVPEAFVTAHDAMITQAQLRAGEWVLVNAVGSGVGTAGLQLAKAWGARVVGTARTPAKLERCKALGLDAGIVPRSRDDGTLDIDALVGEIVAASGSGVDVVLELAGGAYADVDIGAAAAKGRIVLVSAMAGGHASLPILAVMSKRLTITGTVLRSRTAEEKAAATDAFHRADVVPLLASGALAPVIDTVMPLDRAQDAYELLATDTTFGKVVLDCR